MGMDWRAVWEMNKPAQKCRRWPRSAIFLSPCDARLQCTLTHMQVPAAAPSVVIICGPSGVGKDAVLAKLKEVHPELHFIVTATSRSGGRGRQVGSVQALQPL